MSVATWVLLGYLSADYIDICILVLKGLIVALEVLFRRFFFL